MSVVVLYQEIKISLFALNISYILFNQSRKDDLMGANGFDECVSLIDIPQSVCKKTAMVLIHTL